MKRWAVGLFTILTAVESYGSYRDVQLSSTKITTVKPVRQNLVKRTFTPHLTVAASTRDWGKISLQRTPGANLNTSFLMSSITIAALPHLELGTMPIFYNLEGHRQNFNAKLNFWRSRQVDLALGYSLADLEANDSESDDKYLFRTSTGQLVANIYPLGTKFSFSGAYTKVHSAIVSSPLLRDYSTRWTDEYAIDISYPVAKKIDFTIGGGSLRVQGFSAHEDRQFGVGFTTAIYRPKKFFSKPAVGFHCVPNGNYWQILIGTDIL